MPSPDYPFDNRYMWRDRRFVLGRFGQVARNFVPTDSQVSFNQRQIHSHHMENLLWWLDRCTDRATYEFTPERFNGTEWEEFTPTLINPFSLSQSGGAITPTGNLYGYPMDHEGMWTRPRGALSGLFLRMNLPVDGYFEIENKVIASSVLTDIFGDPIVISSHPWGFGDSPYDGGFFPHSPYYQDTVDPSGRWLNIGQLGMLTSDTYAQLFPPSLMHVEGSGTFGGLAVSVAREGSFNQSPQISYSGQPYPTALTFKTAGIINYNGAEGYGGTSYGFSEGLLFGSGEQYGSHAIGVSPNLYDRSVVNLGQNNSFHVINYDEVGEWDGYTASIINQHSDNWAKLRTYGAYTYPLRNHVLTENSNNNVSNIPSITLDLGNPVAYQIRAGYDTLPSKIDNAPEWASTSYRPGGEASGWDGRYHRPAWWYEEGAYQEVTSWYNSCRYIPIDVEGIVYSQYQPGTHGNPDVSGQAQYIVSDIPSIGQYKNHIDAGKMDNGHRQHPDLWSSQSSINPGDIAVLITHASKERVNLPPVGEPISDDARQILKHLDQDTYIFMSKESALREAMKYLAAYWLFGSTAFEFDDAATFYPTDFDDYPLNIRLYSADYTGSGLKPISPGNAIHQYVPARQMENAPIGGDVSHQASWWVTFSGDHHPAYETMATDLGNWIVDSILLTRGTVNTATATDTTQMADNGYTIEVANSGIDASGPFQNPFYPHVWTEHIPNPHGIAHYETALHNLNPTATNTFDVYGAGYYGPRVASSGFNDRTFILVSDDPSSRGILPSPTCALYGGLNRRLATLDDVKKTEWPNEWGTFIGSTQTDYENNLTVREAGAYNHGQMQAYTYGHYARAIKRQSPTTAGLVLTYGPEQIQSTSVGVFRRGKGFVINTDALDDYHGNPHHWVMPDMEMGTRWGCWLSYTDKYSLREKFGIASSGDVVKSHFLSSVIPAVSEGFIENKVNDVCGYLGNSSLSTSYHKLFGYFQDTQKTWNPWNCSFKISYGWYQMPTGNVLESGATVESRFNIDHRDEVIFTICSGIEEGLHDGSLSVTSLIDKNDFEPSIFFEKEVTWGTFEAFDTDLESMLNAAPPFPSAVFFLACYPDPIRQTFPSGTIKHPHFTDKVYIDAGRKFGGDGIWCATDPTEAAFVVTQFPKGGPDTNRGVWHNLNFEVDRYSTWNQYNEYPFHENGVLGVSSGEIIAVPRLFNTGELMNPKQSGVSGLAFTSEHAYSFITSTGVDMNRYNGLLGSVQTSVRSNAQVGTSVGLNPYFNPRYSTHIRQSDLNLATLVYPDIEATYYGVDYTNSPANQIHLVVASGNRISDMNGGLGAFAGPIYELSKL